MHHIDSNLITSMYILGGYDYQDRDAVIDHFCGIAKPGDVTSEEVEFTIRWLTEVGILDAGLYGLTIRVHRSHCVVQKLVSSFQFKVDAERRLESIFAQHDDATP